MRQEMEGMNRRVKRSTAQVKDAKDAPPYNATDTCPKCGHGTISTQLCDGSNCNRFLDTMPWDRETEHLDRTCTRCGYDYWQKPLS